MEYPSIWDLPRNDIDACHAYWREHPDMTADDWRVLLRLQDDPSELIEAAKGWPRKAAGSGA